MKAALIIFASVVGWVFAPDGQNVVGGLHRTENPMTNGCYSVDWNPPEAGSNDVVFCVGYRREGDHFVGIFKVNKYEPPEDEPTE